MKKILLTIALLSSGMLNAMLGGDGKTNTPQGKTIGGNPATWTPTEKSSSSMRMGSDPRTWTPLPDISNFRQAMPKPSANSMVVMAPDKPNNINVGQGFQISSSASNSQTVSITPNNLFRTYDVTPESSMGLMGASKVTRYVAIKPGKAAIKVMRSMNGKQQPTKMYKFNIGK